MKLTLINGNGGTEPDVAVHKAGCRDVAKAGRGHDHWDEEHDSKHDVWYDYNADFLAEDSGAWPLTFYPCTKGLPDGGEYNT